MPGDELRCGMQQFLALILFFCGPLAWPTGRVVVLQHGEGDGGTSDDEKEMEGLEKSFEAGAKLAKGHRRVCLECFAPEGTPIQVCMYAFRASSRFITAACVSGRPHVSCLARGLTVALLPRQIERVFLLQIVSSPAICPFCSRKVADPSVRTRETNVCVFVCVCILAAAAFRVLARGRPAIGAGKVLQ